MPPIQQGRKLDPLDSAHDPEPQIEPAEMSLHRARCDVEVFADLDVVTSQKKERNYIPLARSQLYGLALEPSIHIPSRMQKMTERPVEFDASCNGGGARISERAGTALKITDTFEFALQNSDSLAALCDYFCKALRDSSASESPLAMAS